MTGTVRSAFIKWPHFNAQLRDTVAGLTGEQLAKQPSPARWPMWATIGHLACQRVFNLCDAAGEPGAETTPFTSGLEGLRNSSGMKPYVNSPAI